MNIQDSIDHVSDGNNLNQEQMTAVMNQIMQGQATDIQIASFLTALKLKGETIDEITAAANVMREAPLKQIKKYFWTLVVLAAMGVKHLIFQQQVPL